MLDHSSRDEQPADPLTDILRGLRLEGVDYGRCHMTAPWAFSHPDGPVARFYFVATGGCWLLSPGGEWIPIGAGDAILIPRGAAHTLASRPGVDAQPFRRLACKTLCDSIFEFQSGGEGESCLLFSGAMTFNVDALHPLLRMMPDVMRTQELMEQEPAIPHLLEAMGREVAMDRVGAGGILARLADVLAASIIRSWVEHGCGDATGWIAALRDKDIGRVLAAIHLHPERGWTVAALARVMGASRSSFADKFLAAVGETPARYLAQVRMHQARRWIQRDRMRISEVAQRLGYGSEAAFSRAFKRLLGQAPSRLRSPAPHASASGGLADR